MMNFHSQCEVMLSSPEYVKSIIGARLIRKADLMVKVMVLGEFLEVFRRAGRSVGVRIVVSVSSIRVLRSRAISTTFTWICTKVDGS